MLLLLHLNKIKEILNKIKEIMQRWTKVGVGGNKKNISKRTAHFRALQLDL